MTERYGEITERIESIRQLGAVVNAMRGIAGARALQARAALAAVDGHAAVIASAIGEVLALMPPTEPDPAPGRTAVVAFGAEQGFVGGFTERVLDAFVDEPAESQVFLLGTRAAAVAAERGLRTVWQAAMPPHPPGIPPLADRVAEALFVRIAAGEIGRLDALWSDGEPGEGAERRVVRRRLFPLERSAFVAGARMPPLLNLPPETLLQEMTEDHVHAQLCMAALHALAAENEARMQSMAAAHGQITRKLEGLGATQRQVRQDEITAEIVELASGVSAAESAG